MDNPKRSRVRDWWRKSRRARKIAAIGAGVIYVMTRIASVFDWLFKRWPLY